MPKNLELVYERSEDTAYSQDLDWGTVFTNAGISDCPITKCELISEDGKQPYTSSNGVVSMRTSSPFNIIYLQNSIDGYSNKFQVQC